MAEVNTHRVWLIVQGMTRYVSRIFRNKVNEEKSAETSEEDLYLPRDLKMTIAKFLDHFKGENFVSAYNHVVDMEDREDHLKKRFRSGLMEVAKDLSHDEFLRECTLYIMSATEMDILGFSEAINIVMEAIYHACINTKQHEHLILWENQPGENSKENNLNNDTYHRNGDADSDPGS